MRSLVPLALVLAGCPSAPAPFVTNLPPPVYEPARPMPAPVAPIAEAPPAPPVAAPPVVLAPPPVALALPAVVPEFPRIASCDPKKRCDVKLGLDPAPVAPGQAPSPARLGELVLGEGSTVAFAPDDALTVIGVVLEGAVTDERRPDEPRTVHTDEHGKPLPVEPLGPLAGFRVVGAGFTLAASKPSRVLLATVQRRDVATFTARGKPWKKRPGDYADAFDHFAFGAVAPVRWGGGRFAAAIALEDTVEETPVFVVPADPPGDKRQKPIPTAPVPSVERVTRRPDASLTLLGIDGGAEVAEHAHDGAWEHLAILAGAGTMKLGDQTVEVSPGRLVTIPRGVPHAFRAKPGLPVIAVQLYSPPGPEQRFKALAAPAP